MTSQSDRQAEPAFSYFTSPHERSRIRATVAESFADDFELVGAEARPEFVWLHTAEDDRAVQLCQEATVCSQVGSARSYRPRC
jgi:hypothetical protein